MRAMIFGLVGLLAACGAAPDSSSSPTPSPAPSASAPAVAATPVAEARSCRDEIGEAAARTLVDQCIAVSPATHPPCNAANSCAMIRGEITRACGLLAGSDPMPAPCAPAAQSQPSARQTPVEVIDAYYAAIAAHDYARAWGLWSGEGEASGKTLAAFTQGFADTATVAVETGAPSDPEGAAGSSYVTVPVVVRATTRAGARQRFEGAYVLRRVNDVPGATAEQLAWRIRSASLKAVP